MASHRIPVISEKTYTYKGIFDMNGCLSDIKTFIEEYKHYDLSEKEADETNSNGKREFLGYFEAEFEYNDVYKFVLTFEIKMEGKEIIANEDFKGGHSLVEGTARIIINGYIIEDHMHKRHRGPIFEFLEKIYSKYIDDEHHHAIAHLARDVGQIYNRFKQGLNAKIK
jgi:hypothetical protein